MGYKWCLYDILDAACPTALITAARSPAPTPPTASTSTGIPPPSPRPAHTTPVASARSVRAARRPTSVAVCVGST